MQEERNESLEEDNLISFHFISCMPTHGGRMTHPRLTQTRHLFADLPAVFASTCGLSTASHPHVRITPSMCHSTKMRGASQPLATRYCVRRSLRQDSNLRPPTDYPVLTAFQEHCEQRISVGALPLSYGATVLTMCKFPRKGMCILLISRLYVKNNF